MGLELSNIGNGFLHNHLGDHYHIKPEDHFGRKTDLPQSTYGRFTWPWSRLGELRLGRAVPRMDKIMGHLNASTALGIGCSIYL